MDRSIPLLLIGLVFGGGIGFVIAAANGITLDGHDHATGHSTHAPQHDHSATIDVTGSAPTLNMTITADPASGWNLHLNVSNFRFTPEHAGQAANPGEGHAHLYINDTKIARIYGPWFHIGTLPAGQIAIRAALYSNDHKALTVNGTPISQTVTIENH